MPYTPSGMSVADAEQLSRSQQEQLRANKSRLKEGQLFYVGIGEGGKQLAQYSGGKLNTLGFKYPSDWQGKTIGQLQNETTKNAVSQLGVNDSQIIDLTNDSNYLWRDVVGGLQKNDVTDFGQFRQGFGPVTNPTGDLTALPDAALGRPEFNTGSTTYGPGTWSNGVKTAEWTDPATGAKTPSGIGMPGDAFATPAFRDGLSQAQKDSITQLSQKPIAQWTQTDKNNWNYATNNSALPGSPTSPKLATLTSPTGEKKVVTVGSADASGLLAQGWTLGDKVGGGTVTSGLLTPTTPINIGGSTTQTANNSSVVQAGADATSKSIDEEIKRLTELQTPPETPLSKEVQALMDELKLGSDTLTGRGAAQKLAEQQQGIEEKRAALAAKNSELKIKLAEIKSLDASYQLANQTEEGRTQTLSRLQGAQAQNYKMYLAQRNTLTADAGYMQAELLGMQGQLDSAQAAADRAVELEYADRESAYNAKIAKLNILQPQLAKEEAKYAAALKSILENQASAVADEKQKKKDLMSTIIQAAGNGAPQSVISQMKAAPDVLSATIIANKWLKGTLETATKGGAGGSGGGSGSSTNRTALFKQAGLSQYPTDFQNWVKSQTDSWLTGLNAKSLSDEYDRFKTGKPIEFSQNQALLDMNSQLSGVTGGDGFVSPDDWQKARNAWINEGLNPTVFDTKFKGFKNPNNKNYNTDKKSKSSSSSMSDEEFIKLLDK